MGRNKRSKKNNDFFDRDISKGVERKTKRGTKRRVSEKLGSIRSIEDAESLDETDDLLEE